MVWKDARTGIVKSTKIVMIRKASMEAMKQNKYNDVWKRFNDVGRKGVEPIQNDELSDRRLS